MAEAPSPREFATRQRLRAEQRWFVPVRSSPVGVAALPGDASTLTPEVKRIMNANADPPVGQAPFSRLRAFILRLGASLHAAADAGARRRGWTVTPSASGLSRSYRDPRFDRFARCPACAGKGRDASTGTACLPCDGSGRVVRTEQVGCP